MTIKLSLPGITLNKAATGKLLSHDAEKKTAVIEFPDVTVTYIVEFLTSDETLDDMIGKNITVSTEGIVSLSTEKKAARAVVNNTRGCDERTKFMLMQNR